MSDQKSNLGILRDLKVGEQHAYPISILHSVRSMCSAFGLQWGRVFKTTIDRASRTVTVKRVS